MSGLEGSSGFEEMDAMLARIDAPNFQHFGDVDTSRDLNDSDWFNHVHHELMATPAQSADDNNATYAVGQQHEPEAVVTPVGGVPMDASDETRNNPADAGSCVHHEQTVGSPVTDVPPPAYPKDEPKTSQTLPKQQEIKREKKRPPSLTLLKSKPVAAVPQTQEAPSHTTQPPTVDAAAPQPAATKPVTSDVHKAKPVFESRAFRLRLQHNAAKSHTAAGDTTTAPPASRPLRAVKPAAGTATSVASSASARPMKVVGAVNMPATTTTVASARPMKVLAGAAGVATAVNALKPKGIEASGSGVGEAEPIANGETKVVTMAQTNDVGHAAIPPLPAMLRLRRHTPHLPPLSAPVVGDAAALAGANAAREQRLRRRTQMAAQQHASESSSSPAKPFDFAQTLRCYAPSPKPSRTVPKPFKFHETKHRHQLFGACTTTVAKSTDELQQRPCSRAGSENGDLHVRHRDASNNAIKRSASLRSVASGGSETAATSRRALPPNIKIGATQGMKSVTRVKTDALDRVRSPHFHSDDRLKRGANKATADGHGDRPLADAPPARVLGEKNVSLPLPTTDVERVVSEENASKNETWVASATPNVTDASCAPLPAQNDHLSGEEHKENLV